MKPKQKPKHDGWTPQKQEQTEQRFVECSVCGETPIIRESGMCGPCTFGTADAIGEGEYIPKT